MNIIFIAITSTEVQLSMCSWHAAVVYLQLTLESQMIENVYFCTEIDVFVVDYIYKKAKGKRPVTITGQAKGIFLGVLLYPLLGGP